jgi:hypothetical protein
MVSGEPGLAIAVSGGNEGPGVVELPTVHRQELGRGLEIRARQASVRVGAILLGRPATVTVLTPPADSPARLAWLAWLRPAWPTRVTRPVGLRSRWSELPTKLPDPSQLAPIEGLFWTDDGARLATCPAAELVRVGFELLVP